MTNRDRLYCSPMIFENRVSEVEFGAYLGDISVKIKERKRFIEESKNKIHSACIDCPYKKIDTLRSIEMETSSRVEKIVISCGSDGICPDGLETTRDERVTQYKLPHNLEDTDTDNPNWGTW